MKDERQEQIKLERLLLGYQQMALRTLGGPASFWNGKGVPVGGRRASNPLMSFSPPFGLAAGTAGADFQKKLSTLPFEFNLQLPTPAAAAPILLPRDSGPEIPELSFYELEGERVPCFNIGGEERLSLPPLLQTILKGVHLNDTHKACEQLQIYFSNCTHVQLQLLKQRGVIPPHVFAAGLIRKTDAERLCTLLLHNKPRSIIDPEQRNYPHITATCFPVYHECFGEGHGFFYTDYYTHADSACISCADCEELFTPELFITHSHYNQESRVCHWGFDRSSWRSYLLLSDDEIDDELLEAVTTAFENALEKFISTDKKRKLESDVDTWDENKNLLSSHQPVKRRCLRAPMRASGYSDGEVENSDSRTVLPILDDPDRVVPHTDAHLFEKHFIPNICLQSNSEETKADKLESEMALDLSSPPIRRSDQSQLSPQEKKTTPSSDLHASNDEEELSTTECDITVPTDVPADEEELDVVGEENVDDCDPHSSLSLPPTDEPLTKTEQIENWLQSMQKLFTDVLETSELSPEQRQKKKSIYTKYHTEAVSLLT